MAKLLSNWFDDGRIPDNYVFPPEKRPGDLAVPKGKANVPVVDLHDEENNTIRHIMKASQDFGLFQVPTYPVFVSLINYYCFFSIICESFGIYIYILSCCCCNRWLTMELQQS